MSTKKEAHRSPMWMMIFYIALYATNSVFQNYQTAYFSRVGGLTQGQIGMIMALPPLLAMFAQPAWGYAADKVRFKNTILRVIVAGCCAAMVLMPLQTAIWWLALCTGLYALFQTSLVALGDAIALENLGTAKFGPIRLSGTISFAIFSLLIGRLLSSHPEWMPWASAATFALAFAATYALPPTEGHASHKRVSPLSLLKDKRLAALLGVLLLMQTTMGFFYTFFSVHVLQNLGGDEAYLGQAYLFSALCEIPFLLFADRLYERFGAGLLLLGSAAFLAARWLILSMTGSLAIVMLSQALHGGCFIVMTFAMSRHMNDTVPDELKASGQTLVGIVAMGLSRVLGSFLGGMVASSQGIQRGFLYASMLAAAALGLLWAMHRKGWLRGEGEGQRGGRT